MTGGEHAPWGTRPRLVEGGGRSPMAWWLLPFLATLALGCDRPASPEPAAPPPREGPAPPEPGAPSLPGAVPVVFTEPARHHLRIEDLPPPFATDSARRAPQIVPMPDDAQLRVPPGFAVQVFADGLAMPRWLALTPEGDVLVTETHQDRILRLRDADGDGVAETRRLFADASNGLEIPFGMAFAEREGQRWFYLGNHDAVRRYPYADRLEGKGERIARLPGGGYRQHWTRNVVLAPDGRSLYVSIGSETNVEPEALPRASIQRMDLDGHGQRTVASGLRNPVGLAFQPQTGALYATVNERDHLGDDLVPDFLARIEDGAFYGWPYAYLRPDLLDPRREDDGASERPDLVARTRTPEVLFQAHSAALGLCFYDATAFPARYRGGAFVAFRGSWNRDRGTGYAVVFVPFDAEGTPTGAYEDFVTGFLLDPAGPTTWGRPVGLLALPDGSLLFTEEMNGRIFRVSYRGAAPRE